MAFRNPILTQKSEPLIERNKKHPFRNLVLTDSRCTHSHICMYVSKKKGKGEYGKKIVDNNVRISTHQYNNIV